jgi:hypothetical protein
MREEKRMTYSWVEVRGGGGFFNGRQRNGSGVV